MLVLSGIIGIDGIELAAFGDLQAVVVAPGNISYDHIMAAVLLQRQADAKSIDDLTSAIVD